MSRDDNRYLVYFCALGHCFGIPSPISDSRSRGHCEIQDLADRFETRVYSHEDRHSHRIVAGSDVGRYDTIDTLCFT